MATPAEPEYLSGGEKCSLFMKVYWKSWVVIIAPLVLLPLPIIMDDSGFTCLYVLLLMAVYYVTEALPLAITSMIPMVLFPSLKLVTTEKCCQSYMTSSNFAFLAGLMIASGLQQSSFHKRVVYHLILLSGCSHRCICFVLSFLTFLMSMWLSNSATSIMAVPLAMEILEMLEKEGLGDVYLKSTIPNVSDPDIVLVKRPSRMTVGFLLSIAYSATIGGVSTFLGTTTNLTLQRIYEDEFSIEDTETGTETWMLYHLLPVLVIFFLTWISLQVLFMGLFRPNSEVGLIVNGGTYSKELAQEAIRIKLNEIGTMKFHEGAALILFIICTACSLITYIVYSKKLIESMEEIVIRNSAYGAMTVLAMFIVPSALSFVKFFTASTVEEMPKKASTGVITWGSFKDFIPWELWFMLGSGAAIFEATKASGLAKSTSNVLKILVEDTGEPITVFLIIVLSVLITNICCNTIAANFVLAVLLKLSKALDLHPIRLMVPATGACSLSFLLPISTPPNSIAREAANIKLLDIFLAGIFPTILGICVIWGWNGVMGKVLYSEDIYPV